MRGAALAGAVVAIAALVAAPAHAADMQPWDGTNPFNCVLQYAREGTQFQHPQADPFCVEYDKTHQDISKLGLVKFMTKEPARTSAAVNKCWYYQVDHWTGQLVAGDGSTETYHWDGTYFFDKRFGWGGVHVERFTINHRTADPSRLPGFPDSWKPYFGPGRGGVMFRGDVNVERGCLPRPGNGPSPYAPHGSQSGGGGSSGQPGSYSGGSRPFERLRPPAGTRCRRLGGAAHSGLGRARLGMTRKRLLRALGPSWRRAHGFLHFCVRGGGDLAVHLGRHGRVDFIASAAKSFHAGRARVGSRVGAARRALRGEAVIGRGHDQALVVAHRRWRLVVGIRRGRVRFLVAARRSLSIARLGALLIASGR